MPRATAIRRISALKTKSFKIPELKEIFFFPKGDASKEEKALYLIYGDVCVMSGITDNHGGTAGWPETFISEICLKEKRNPQDMFFYDLHTFASGMMEERGAFKFFRLEFKREETGEISVYDWIPEPIPPLIRQIFADCIGVPQNQLH